jgi:transposase
MVHRSSSELERTIVFQEGIVNIHTIGIDLSKTTFHVVGLDETGNVVLRKKFSRKQLLVYTVKLPRTLIGMEACGGCHYVGRALEEQGHEVRLMPAQYVKAYVKTNKNDYVDAEAIAEAVQRPTMRFVPIKSDEQLDLQALHRVRDRWVARRTAVMNQIRGFLLDRGVTVPKGPSHLRQVLPALLDESSSLFSGNLRWLLSELQHEWNELEKQLEEVSQKIEAIAKNNEVCCRLMEIPGFGPLVSTALMAAIGNGATFRKGRDLAAWLGLVPRQHSTGGKTKLLGISKRGNEYLRRMLLHGARSVMMQRERKKSALGAWLAQLAERTHWNVAVVALANKMARIAWAILTRSGHYRPPQLASTSVEPAISI